MHFEFKRNVEFTDTFDIIWNYELRRWRQISYENNFTFSTAQLLNLRNIKLSIVFNSWTEIILYGKHVKIFSRNSFDRSLTPELDQEWKNFDLKTLMYNSKILSYPFLCLTGTKTLGGQYIYKHFFTSHSIFFQVRRL